MRRIVGPLFVVLALMAPQFAYPVNWANFLNNGEEMGTRENSAGYLRAVARVFEALALVEVQNPSAASEVLSGASRRLGVVHEQLLSFGEVFEENNVAVETFAIRDPRAVVFWRDFLYFQDRYDNVDASNYSDELTQISDSDDFAPTTKSAAVRMTADSVLAVKSSVDQYLSSERFEDPERVDRLLTDIAVLNSLGVSLTVLMVEGN